MITVANHTTIQIIQSWDESEIADLYRSRRVVEGGV